MYGYLNFIWNEYCRVICKMRIGNTNISINIIVIYLYLPNYLLQINSRSMQSESVILFPLSTIPKSWPNLTGKVSIRERIETTSYNIIVRAF